MEDSIMGSWGVKIFQNDVALDIRDEYKEQLRSKDDVEARIYINSVYETEYKNTDDEALFWYALAATQYDLGRLDEDVKEKALYYINNPNQDEDLELYKEAGDKMLQARLNELQNLKQLLLGKSKLRKKILQYKNKLSKYKIGDVLAFDYISKDFDNYDLLELVMKSLNLSKEDLRKQKETYQNKKFIGIIVEIEKCPITDDYKYYAEMPIVAIFNWEENLLPTEKDLEGRDFILFRYGRKSNIIQHYNNLKEFKPQFLFNSQKLLKDREFIYPHTGFPSTSQMVAYELLLLKQNK